jgi:hypothetical protein
MVGEFNTVLSIMGVLYDSTYDNMKRLIYWNVNETISGGDGESG